METTSAVRPKAAVWYRVITCVFSVVFPVVDWIIDQIYYAFNQLYVEKKRLPPVPDPVLLLSATDLAQKIRQQELKSEDVVQMYINRAKEVQPVINFYTDQRFDKALEEAKEADKVAQNEKDKDILERDKPLLGVPITTKNAIAVQGLHDDTGLYYRKESIAEEDADVIKTLKKAGAIVICVTNVPEACFWPGSFNKLFGKTLNPHDTRRCVGGSSGGEGAGVAAAATALGIGSDYAGSIRIPAYFCGIFGHKPSPYLFSLKGHHPISNDTPELACTIGPMSRHAKDLKLTMKVLTQDSTVKLNLDEKVDLSSLRVYYSDEFKSDFVSKTDPNQERAIRQVVDHLGNVCKRQPKRVDLKGLQHAAAITYWYFTDEVDLTSEMTNFNGKACLWLETLKWIFGRSKYCYTTLLMGSFLGYFVPVTGQSFRVYLAHVLKSLQEEIDTLLGNDGILILPTFPHLPPFYYRSTFNLGNLGCTGIFNRLGVPSTACPIGLTKDKIPCGIQVVANRNMDRISLAVAEELERKFGGAFLPCGVERKL